jgi:hypothetical protein
MLVELLSGIDPDHSILFIEVVRIPIHHRCVPMGRQKGHGRPYRAGLAGVSSEFSHPRILP